jgi:23S rRNA pseudouridine955/2504/2580 synthase/23S rRNA pseudouridine1911/1915/1917 synthase
VSKLPYQIIHENDRFLVVDKASGLLTIPDRIQSAKSLKEMLMDRFENIYTVHRLDRDTSGLVIFAKNEKTHQFLCSLFEKREIEKYYTGVVLGKPSEMEGTIDAPISEHPTLKGTMVVHRNGKPASTSFKVLDAQKSYSLLEFQLHTGRTHQIRVHAKQMGNPLAVDDLYGDGKPVLLSMVKKGYKLSKLEDEERPFINRLALHAHRVSFNDETGEQIEIASPMPKEFTALMTQIKKWG